MLLCACSYIFASLLWSAFWFIAGVGATYLYLSLTDQLQHRGHR